jgi:hypothetical protein
MIAGSLFVTIALAADEAPTALKRPTVTGSPFEGQTLVTSDGEWGGSEPISYRYQWRRCDAAGAGCTDIAGATASRYTPGAEDVGFTVRSRVFATNPIGTDYRSSAVTDVVTRGAPPTALRRPVVTGSPFEGQTLVTSDGEWGGSEPISYRYQWRRCDAAGAGCADITGATASRYTLGAEDVGFTVRSRVFATNPVGTDYRSSAVTDVVTRGEPPSALSRPVVAGVAREYETLSTSDGAWAGTQPISYGYLWVRCDEAGASCTGITGATGSRYTLGAEDVGFTVRSRVFATNSVGTDYRSSAATSVITPPVGGAVQAPANSAYFGAWTSGNTGLTVEEREAQIGRRYNVVHRYHDWDSVFPTSEEQAWAREGRILFLAVEPRIYGSPTIVPWADIAAGEQDAVIDAMAARVKALELPMLMDFTHEPEGQTQLGTPQQFAAAYRHLVQRFRAQGATNVSWVWTVIGYAGYYGQYTGGLYPGDDVVDWIGWDPYNWYVCNGSEWKSFARKVSGFYDWLLANGHGDKPFMLSEYGSAEHQTDTLAKGQWFRDALSSLKSGAFPNLKALVYFDSDKTGQCDWRLDTSATSLDGFAQMGQDPYLNP